MSGSLASLYEQIRDLKAQGQGVAEIARRLKTTKATVYRALKSTGSARWEGVPYDCEGCGRVTLLPGPVAARLTCPRCAGFAYPEGADAEMRRRLGALVRRLEAEVHAD